MSDSSNIDEVPNIKVLDYRFTQLEKKLDSLSEQLDLLLKSNARLRVDLQEIIKEAVHSTMNKRAIQGYSKITS